MVMSYPLPKQDEFSPLENNITTLELAKTCAKLASDKKAEHISVLEISQLTSFADYFVICSAGSARQAQAVARHIESEVRTLGFMPLGIEGLNEGHWILLDLGDIVVHVFTDEARLHFDLEGLWVDAPRLEDEF